MFTSIWIMLFFMFLISARNFNHPLQHLIDKQYYVWALVIILVGALCLPVHVFHYRSRSKLFKILLNLCLTPFGKVGFAECFVADVLTSMVIPLTDIAYTMCYLPNFIFRDPRKLLLQSNKIANTCSAVSKYFGPVLALLPYLCRLLQCCRRFYDTSQRDHALNGAKYMLNILVLLLNAMHAFFDPDPTSDPYLRNSPWGIAAVIFAILSTMYSYYWDVYKDWGLGDWKSKNFFLRDELLYPNKSMYYGIIVFDLAFRFAWIFNMLSSLIPAHQIYLKILFGGAELLRRAVWSLLRLEWAIISNSESFRRYKYVPPLAIN